MSPQQAPGSGPVPGPPKGGRLSPIDSKQQQTDEILNSILPPREWNESGQLWVQQVSSTPATRLDVVNLQEELDKRLQQRQARETGICPVRRELYSQCFGKLFLVDLDVQLYETIQPSRPSTMLLTPLLRVRQNESKFLCGHCIVLSHGDTTQNELCRSQSNQDMYA